MKILLATDGSEFSERAAGFLAALDFSSDDEIMILHAISCVPFHEHAQSYEAAIRLAKRDPGRSSTRSRSVKKHPGQNQYRPGGRLSRPGNFQCCG
jgi:hypothetical protein